MDIKGVGAAVPEQKINKVNEISSGQTTVSGNTNGEQVPGSKNQKVNEKQLQDAADKINKFLEDKKTHIEYEMHDKLHEVMFKIIDDNTGQIVQEVPSKKVLDMVAKMCEMAGLILDHKA